MKKNKYNEIIKVSVASILSIGAFSLAFISSNNIVFAAITSQTIRVPSAHTVSNIQHHIDAIPEAYPHPIITAYEFIGVDSISKSSNVLSIEEASEIGARYIWEVLGENIDGKNVYITYQSFPSSTRTHWVGLVSEGSAREYTLEFTIDAVTGERISIKDMRSDDLPERSITRDEYLNFNIKDDDVEKYMQLAIDYAQKHFNFTEVVEAVYENAHVNQIRSASGERDSRNPDLPRNIINYNETVLRFIVTDETGRMARMEISIETGRLRELNTIRNDIIPGFQSSQPIIR